MVQRAELLDAVLTDLYGARKLLARGAPPGGGDPRPRGVPAPGRRRADTVADQRLFMIAADLGRDGTGSWKVISDRTQAPSGAGFAMQNRRVVSRVLPDLYHQAHLHRLTPFFQAMRLALVDAAPSDGRGPPGRRAQPRHPLGDRVRPGLRGLAARLPAARGQRPDRARRPGVDAGARQARAGRRHPAPRRLDLDGRPRAPGRVAARASPGCWSASGRARSAWSTTLGSGHLGEPGAAAVPARPLRAAARASRCGCRRCDTWWCGDPAGLSPRARPTSTRSWSGRSAAGTAAA